MSPELTPFVEAAYNSVHTRAPWVTHDAFVKFVEQSEVHPVEVEGRAVGAIVVNGPEIHACVDPEAHGLWYTKRAARLLSGVIEKNGYARTSATTEEGVKFVRRLGFEPVGDHWEKG